jgi:hypothetical protein
MKGSLCFLISICSLLLLNACGGGSGSSSVTQQVQTLLLASTTPPAGHAGVAYPGFTFTVASGGTAPFTWSESGALPPGLSLSTGGVLSGTPTDGGSFPITVTVKDSSSPPQTASQKLTIVINNGAPPPVFTINSGAPPAGQVGVAYPGFTFTVASGGTAPFTWSESGALPPGLSLGTGGVLSGTPTDGGSFPITVTVKDSSSPPQTASQKLTIVINNGAPPAALTITSRAPPTGNPGYAYNGSTTGFSLTASGGVAPYTWSWAANAGSSLPPGLGISTTANNTGAISGIPTTDGNYNVVVTVSDSESPVSMTSNSYTITISAPTSLAITSGSPPSGQVETQYDIRQVCISNGVNAGDTCMKINGFVLSGSGGLAPYTWSWVAGSGSSLPPGLGVAFGPIGFLRNGDVVSGTRIAGTPTEAGSYNVVVTLTDSESPAAKISANYTIMISPPLPPPPPSISGSPGPPTGVLNLAYDFTFTVASGGIAPFQWSETGALPPGLSLSTGGLLSGIPTATGSFPITVQVRDSRGEESAPATFTIQVFSHGFKATGSMETGRMEHTVTLLSNGTVLVAGGFPDGYDFHWNVNALATAELYDPNSGAFAPTGSMQTARTNHTATLLSSLLLNRGKVLVTGGGTETAELFDPSTGTFTATGSMETSRSFHTATLLNDGRVLITGGLGATGVLATAELFDPTIGSFSPTGSMETARFYHTATLLNDGRVLVTGGMCCDGQNLATAELFDPSSGTFTSTGSMESERTYHTATLLNNGTVLVTGGLGNVGLPVATAELFDPSTGTFTATGSMVTTCALHSATLLNNGTVLVTGGEDDSLSLLAIAELFDPSTGTFTETGSMETARVGPISTLLQDGAVLVTGGFSGYDENDFAVVLSTAELYQ